MTVESDADRRLFLDPAFGGTVATLRPMTGGDYPVAGRLDVVTGDALTGQYMGDVYSGPGVDAPAPRFLALVSDFPASEGDTLSVGDTDYRVAHLRPDGTGMIVAVLEVP